MGSKRRRQVRREEDSPPSQPSGQAPSKFAGQQWERVDDADHTGHAAAGVIQRTSMRHADSSSSASAASIRFEPERDPDPDGLSDRYGFAVEESTARRVAQLEREHGEMAVRRWADEGMTVDTMGKPRSMAAFRERQRDRPAHVPHDVERQNEASLRRNRHGDGDDSRSGDAGVSDIIRSVVSAPGRPLDEGIHREMEERFGESFADVRIHTGPRAAAAAESIDARAFTVGNHVAFNRGEYNPESTDGKRLLAHELAHVRQQTDASVKTLPPDGGSLAIDPDPGLEREADAVADAVAKRPARVPESGSASGSASTSDRQPARKPEDAPAKTPEDAPSKTPGRQSMDTPVSSQRRWMRETQTSSSPRAGEDAVVQPFGGWVGDTADSLFDSASEAVSDAWDWTTDRAEEGAFIFRKYAPFITNETDESAALTESELTAYLADVESNEIPEGVPLGPEHMVFHVHGFGNTVPTGIERIKDMASAYQDAGADAVVSGLAWDSSQYLNWPRAKQDAVERGRQLARFLLAYADAPMNEDTRITLQGHSLGTRVVLEALVALHEAGATDVVETVVLKGGAVDRREVAMDEKYGPAIEATADSVHNFLDEDDTILGWVFWFFEGGPYAIGRYGAPEGEIPDNWTDHEITGVVQGHTSKHYSSKELVEEFVLPHL